MSLLLVGTPGAHAYILRNACLFSHQLDRTSIKHLAFLPARGRAPVDHHQWALKPAVGKLHRVGENDVSGAVIGKLVHELFNGADRLVDVLRHRVRALVNGI